MMDCVCSLSLTSARHHAVQAGRLLALLRVPIGNGYNFGPMMSIYADLLDPDTTGQRQYAACVHLAPIVSAHVTVAITSSTVKPHGSRYQDPYRREYRLDERAALLEICRDHLEKSLQAFAAAGELPQRPYRIIIS